MNVTLWTTAFLTLSSLCAAAGDAGAQSAAPVVADANSHPLKLLFSGSGDVADTWGKLHFGVTPVRLIRECEALPFAVAGCFPLPDGAWEVFGQQFTQVSRGNAPFEEVNTWKIIRATTRDGMTYENQEVVIDQAPAAWTSHCVLEYNPEAKEYLLLKLKVDSYGFAYTAFFSADGKHWQEYSQNPLFYEGDAMSLFWSPALHRYVCVSKSLQPYRKHIRDHGGATKSLGDDALRDRRVLMMRSSSDGRHWEPAVSLPDVWDRHGEKASHPPELLTVPDGDDPPDMEFYSGNGFWYRDRAYMMVLNYAASPVAAGKHAPQLDNEWWTSPDGLHWERPARGINALEVFPKVARLESHPMIIKGSILFPRDKMLLGLPQDRISCVGVRANGEFSTKPFTMPDADLLLNAAVPAPERLFAKDQAYVMVGIVDDASGIVPGFEPEKCTLHDEDRCDIPLKWNEASARPLAGKTVRLRFLIRSANIYAVTAGQQP